MEEGGGGGFRRAWVAEVLAGPPMIAPARQFVYPMRVAGEEDAMERGALLALVRPEVGGTFLATCALGFLSRSVPTGVWGCPRAEEMCAVELAKARMAPKIGPTHGVQPTAKENPTRTAPT